MKTKSFFFLIPFLLISCSSTKTSNNETNQTYKDEKTNLLNKLDENNVQAVNMEAIEQGFYKPMYRLSSYSVSRIVYPFKTTKLSFKAANINNFIILNERITAEDKNALVNQKYKTKENAKTYLASKGYTFKNDVVLPITGIEPIDFLGSAFIENILYKQLFSENSDGSFSNDLAVSLEPTSRNSKTGYVLTIQNNVYWKDFEGNNVRKVTSDDVIKHDYYPHKTDAIKEIIKIDDYKIFFVVNNDLSADEVKKEIINRFNIPSPGNEPLYNQNDCRVYELDNGYRIVIGDVSINYLIEDENIDFDYIKASSDIDKIYHIQDTFNAVNYTYGFALNEEGGNDAYKNALSNVYFRKAILSVLSHDKIKELSHNASLFKGVYDTAAYRYFPTSQTNPKLESVDIEEGLNEAKSQYNSAKANGLGNETIEIYTIDGTPNLERQEAKMTYLESAFKEVFDDEVKIIFKNKPIDFYATYNYYDNVYMMNSSDDFYNEMQLDGYYYLTESEYIKDILK